MLKTNEPKSTILEQLRNQIATAKGSANTVRARTSSNVPVDILIAALQTMFNARKLIRDLRALVAPGDLRQWARDQYDDLAYDIVADLTTLDTALTDAATWIHTNVPKDAQGYYGMERLNLTTGFLERQAATPAQLVPLNPLLDAVIAA